MNTRSHKTALVLAAHGATDDPRCAAPVRRHAEAIGAMRLFDEVASVFWKEPPHFREIFEVTGARDLLVVPVMTAGGYYSNTVLPREVRAENPPAGRTVRLAEPIGELPGMTGIIVDQAVSAATEAGIEPRDAHVLLIGHGTRRDPVRSGATTYRHAADVCGRSVFHGVGVGFLEQDPEVGAAFAAIPKGCDPVIVVPFLIANGGHGADDIPAALDADSGARLALVRGRPVLFADAVGEHPRLVNLILQSAEQAQRPHSRVA